MIARAIQRSGCGGRPRRGDGSLSLAVTRVGVVGLGDHGSRDRPGLHRGRVSRPSAASSRRRPGSGPRERIAHFVGRKVEKGTARGRGGRRRRSARLELTDDHRRSGRLRLRDRGGLRGPARSSGQLFEALEAVVSAEALLATNTSALSVTSVAAVLERPERAPGPALLQPGAADAARRGRARRAHDPEAVVEADGRAGAAARQDADRLRRHPRASSSTGR